MSDISFSCSHCNQTLIADEVLSGNKIECPSCNKQLVVPGGQQKVRVAAKIQDQNGCPKCKTSKIARCEMVYAQGTTTGQISGAVIGFDIEEDGISPSLIGGGSVGTKSQSLIAQYAAPPEAPTSRVALFGGLWFLFIGVPWAFWWFRSLDPVWSSLVMYAVSLLVPVVVSICVGAWIGFKLGPSEGEKQYKKQLSDWEKTWICLSCGNQWIPIQAPKN